MTSLTASNPWRKSTHMTRHDELTGLPNRNRFIDVLKVALREADKSQASVAVVEINLNDFNSVNDRHGYAIGDRVLKAIAEGMEAECRPGEMVARLGGDRFAAHKTLASKEDARDLHGAAAAQSVPNARHRRCGDRYYRQPRRRDLSGRRRRL